MPVRIEALGPGHRPLLTGFQNQHPSLVEYLKRYALRHATKDLLARTFVAIDDTPTGTRLAGYFSLATVSVDRAAAERHPNLARLPPFPIPGVLLARLAVDTRVQGQGLGRYPFEEALGLTLQLAKGGPSRSVSWSLTSSTSPPLGSTNGAGSPAWVMNTSAGWSSTFDRSSSRKAGRGDRSTRSWRTPSGIFRPSSDNVQGHPPCGHVLQETVTPVCTDPSTEQTPLQDCRQVQEIGAVPQLLVPHVTSTAPPAMMKQS